ncbi:hypothetical protein MKX01_036555, partial [Papaver californicum]
RLLLRIVVACNRRKKLNMWLKCSLQEALVLYASCALLDFRVRARCPSLLI